MTQLPGSRWWKVDFHAHTPCSVCYAKDHPEKEALKKRPPHDWLLDYMKAGIDCVAITDHNSGNAIDDFKNAYEDLSERKPAGFRELAIFPGVEITTQNDIHLLGIFPEIKTSEDINSIVDRCRYNGIKGASNSCTEMTTSNVVQEIVEAGGIAIPAHVDSRKGLFKEVSGAPLEEILDCKQIMAMESEEPWLCITPEEYKHRKLDWAIVAGSDQHHPDGEYGKKFPGSHFTWVKMETPCFEELYQALRAHDVCILDGDTNKKPNETPEIYLRSLTIKEMGHCGVHPSPALKVPFSPFFNAIIGGRGSGKSTMLESVRIVSRRTEELRFMEKLANDLKEFMRLTSANGVMTDSTELLLELHRRGVDYRLTWARNTDPRLEKLVEGEWESCEEGDILERFPLNIYSQKQIFTLASEPTGLLEVIDRSVDRKEWQGRWDTQESLYLQACEKLRELKRQISNEKGITARLDDISNDMKHYEDKGHGDILKEYQYRKGQAQVIPLDDDFDQLADQIEDLTDEIIYVTISDDLFVEDDPVAEEIKSIYKTTEAELETIKKELLALKQKVEKASRDRKAAIEKSQWYIKTSEISEKYSELEKEYEDKDSSLTDYETWVEQRGECKLELVKIAKLKKEVETLEDDTQKKRSGLAQLHRELMLKRKEFIKTVLKNNAYVQIDFALFGDPANVETEFRELFGLSKTAYEPSIYDEGNRQGLLWDIITWQENGLSEKDLHSAIKELKDRVAELVFIGKTENTPEYVHGKLAATLQAKYQQDPSCMDKLLYWYPDDLIKVKYSEPDQRQFKELEKGSKGQKAAAILAFFLSHGETPLIIDQPEDDLDSELIYNLIVQQIRDNKWQRQLILVTHNANIVVNGDAELVHALKFSGGQIRSDVMGGLGKQQIREKICDVMEGGKTAFQKRYKRIIRDQ